jgi:hypothetical protein
MPNLFSANGNTLKVLAGQDYDPGITPEIDKADPTHARRDTVRCWKRLRHLRIRPAHRTLKSSRRHDPDTQRPRAYVVPKNHDGIREELADAVLLKAALGMSGK